MNYEVLEAIKTLEARARKVPKQQRTAHYQIAVRRIRDARLFADKNTVHAVALCRAARHLLNLVQYT
jgi:hypothetical protein